MSVLTNLIGLIPGAAKYVPLARFLEQHGGQVADLANTGAKAVDAIQKTDPTIIPHLEELTRDLMGEAGTPSPAGGGTESAKHIVARALVRPDTLSAEERGWLDRASASG